jgi:hypothetical protein
VKRGPFHFRRVSPGEGAAEGAAVSLGFCTAAPLFLLNLNLNLKPHPEMDTTLLHLPHDIQAQPPPRQPWIAYRKKPCGLWHFTDAAGREHGPYLGRGIARGRVRELKPRELRGRKEAA